MNKKVLILAGDYTDDFEIMVPFSVLKMFECDVHVICPGKNKGEFVKTVVHYVSQEDWGLLLKGKPVTYSESLGHPFLLRHEFNWDDVQEKITEYNGLIIPGGRAPEYISLLPKVKKIVIHFILKNKPIGAICHGAQVLAYADASIKKVNFLEGKKMAPYPSISLECKLLGALIDESYPFNMAITDGNLVTAPSWQALPEFMKQYLKLLDITSLPEN